MRIDLHIHSTASDGALAPEAVVEAALAGRLDVIAIADHDTVAGVVPASAAADGRLEVIPAVELSSTRAGREYHILGYYIDPFSAVLGEFTRAAGRRRQDRMAGMVERLGRMGVLVPFDDVLAEAGEAANVGRPHLARVLLQRGHVRTFAEAFTRFIGDGGPAFVPVELLSPEGAVALVHAAGGLAVWAHPPVEVLADEIDGLVQAGLDGVECYRPRTSPPEIERIRAVARERGLLLTGGSDWHGEWQGLLGEFAVGEDAVPEILQRGRIG